MVALFVHEYIPFYCHCLAEGPQQSRVEGGREEGSGRHTHAMVCLPSAMAVTWAQQVVRSEQPWKKLGILATNGKYLGVGRDQKWFLVIVSKE